MELSSRQLAILAFQGRVGAGDTNMDIISIFKCCLRS